MCKASLDEIQREVWKNEEKSYQERRQAFLDDLEEELKELSSMKEKYGKKHEDLLRNIYKTFPPSDDKNKLLNEEKKDWDKDMCKKALLKAILHYHPDKVDTEGPGGMKTKVFHEEITKVLNGCYESYKG